MLSPKDPNISVPQTKLPKLPGILSLYAIFFRPILFLFDAETIHHLVLTTARAFWKLPLARKTTRLAFAHHSRSLPTRLAGLEISNPIGLAAGFDKNALLLPGIEDLGFGFVEIGTVTPRPQLGNPRPRLSRIPEKRALLNRMGFNNNGAEVIAAQLKRVRHQVKVPIGVNIGKNRDTPNNDAIQDYESLFRSFQLTASYFTVNISSPNTPGLRDLQSSAFLNALGQRIIQNRLAQPVFVKLSPNLTDDDLKEICALCGNGKAYAGLILTNTIPTDLGGLSGYPLKQASTALLKIARKFVSPDVPIISVGGIETADDVLERFELGANAVQLYSSLIYAGPALPGRILRELHAKMRRKGIHQLADLRQN